MLQMQDGAVFMMLYMVLILLVKIMELLGRVDIIPIRGDKVIAFSKNFLDETIPLKNGKYDQGYQL